MIKWTTRVYCLVAVLGALIIILTGAASNSVSYSSGPDFGAQQREEFTAFLKEDGVIHTPFIVPESAGRGDNLAIFTADMELWVFKNGGLAYANVPEHGSFGDATGCGWLFVPVSAYESGTTIDIYTKSTYPTPTPRMPVLKYGQIQDIFASTSTRYAPAWLIGVALVILGFVFLVVSKTVVREAKQVMPQLDNSVMYLGIFSILLGLWSGCQLQFISLFIENELAASMLPNVARALMMPIFAFYVYELCSARKSKILAVVCWLNTLVSAAQMLLQLFGIVCLEESVIATQAAIILSSITVSVVVLRDIRHGKATRVMRRHIVPVLVCFVCASLDALAHHLYLSDNDMFGRLGFIYLILFSGFTSLNNARKLLVRGKESELYKRLATSDTLTGLPNRTALVLALSEAEREGRRRYGFFMMDLNDLKICNDSMGHHAGDDYLRAGASIISSSFEGCGSTYRIGGDEFVVMISQPKKERLDECIRTMERKQRQYNESAVYPIGIAWGYADYNKKQDGCFDDTLNWADSHMYELKKDMKPHSDTTDAQKGAVTNES